MDTNAIVKVFLILWICVLGISGQNPTSGIPPRAVDRLVPTWWFSGVTNDRQCTKGSDCQRGFCCVRPMMSANSYCLAIKQRGEVCTSSPIMLYPDEEVYFAECPCDIGLNCMGLQTRSVCIDPRALDIPRLSNRRNSRIGFTENT